ncbi:MAG: adenylate kinase [Candidatus Altiarchaeota archaeon]
MLAIIMGIPGSGKTTVINEAIKILEKEDKKYERVVFGDVIFEIAKKKKFVKDRDEIRKLPFGIQKILQKEAAKKIEDMTKGKNFIIDTHCTISTPKGYIPGLPEYALRELKPDVLIIIEADAKEIEIRRSTDLTRKRDDENVSEIELHQQLNRAITMAYSALTGASVKIIKNSQGKVNDAVMQLVKILSNN